MSHSVRGFTRTALVLVIGLGLSSLQGAWARGTNGGPLGGNYSDRNDDLPGDNMPTPQPSSGPGTGTGTGAGGTGTGSVGSGTGTGAAPGGIGFTCYQNVQVTNCQVTGCSAPITCPGGIGSPCLGMTQCPHPGICPGGGGSLSEPNYAGCSGIGNSNSGSAGGRGAGSAAQGAALGLGDASPSQCAAHPGCIWSEHRNKDLKNSGKCICCKQPRQDPGTGEWKCP
jgi:hypothetical protein